MRPCESVVQLMRPHVSPLTQGGDSAPEENKVSAGVSSSRGPPPPSALTRAFSVLLPVVLIIVAVGLSLYGKKKPE